MDTRTTTAHDLARRSLLLMQRWDDTEAAAIIHPDAANYEAVSEPPAARGRGPAAFKATYGWLHAAFDGLRWDVEDLVAEGDLVVARTVMRGRQVAPFVVYGPDGRPAQVFASNGRSFAASQTHWYRLAEGRIVGHAATATTSARPASSAGCRPPPPSWSARPWPGGALSARGQGRSCAAPARPHGRARWERTNAAST